MKLSALVRNRDRIHPEVQALEDRLAAVKNIEDPGERLIRSEEICRESASILEDKRGVRELLGIGGAVGGAIAAVLSFSPLFPVGLAVGFFLGAVGGMFLTDTASFRAALAVHAQSKRACEEIENGQNPLSLVASPHFDSIMKNYPKLKERFIMASAKDAALKQQTPLQTAAALKHGGNGSGFRL